MASLTPPVRPKIELHVSEPPERVTERLRRGLAESTCCEGVSVGMHAEIFVPEAERSVWSPWLSITVEASEESGSRVRGRFGPHPNLWTLYMFCAFALGVSGFGSLVWGMAQWALGRTPWAFSGIVLCALLGAALYGCSVLGQRLGSEQMRSQRHLVMAMLGEPGQVRYPL